MGSVLLRFVCAVVLLELAVSQQVQQKDDCKWTYKDVFSYDLRPLAKALGKADFRFSETDGFDDTGKLNTNICRNAEVPQVCAREGHSIPAPGYAKFKQIDESWDCYRLGAIGNVQWDVLDSSDPTRGVILTYLEDGSGDADDTGRLHYEIECDPTSTLDKYDDDDSFEEPKGRLEERLCDLPFASKDCTLRWKSGAGCPSCDGGCAQFVPSSWGTQFTAWFLFFVIIYITVGVTYNAREKGRKGIDALPNIEFWREVLQLVREGMAYSSELFTKVTAPQRAMGQKYQKVGGDEEDGSPDSPNSVGEDDTFLEAPLEGDADPE